VNLGALGIAVVVADGKTKLDRPAAIFTALDIPTYLVWDCDKKGDEIKDTELNNALQRLCEIPEEKLVAATDIVSDRFACFETNLSSTVKAEIGADAYREHLDAIKGEYEITKDDDVEKSPFVMTKLLERLAQKGLRSKTLCAIVTAIATMRNLAVQVEKVELEAETVEEEPHVGN